MAESGQFLIDGKPTPFRAGQTIMQAAAEAGHYIPHLCYRPEFPPHGSCKLCSVKANGRFTSACFEPVTEGMKVESETDEIQGYRKRVVQMLFAEGNHYCAFCEKSGNCQLQAVAYHLGMEDTHYAHQYPQRKLDASHPDAMIDHDRCILCELCVRASRDLDRKEVFGVAGRGLQARLVVNSPSGLLGDSNFALTDAAAHVCPVGAILPKRQAFTTPIGMRRYDKHDIGEESSLTPIADKGE
ncbi:2Fe-2S iron-sulfur cluster-binding protein [Niveibacterium sp. 24ML]|uniref:2Fe-2S iron-sulfur cluster-binding protein n=1 Tax=Niveibacterium sp. 24ML TaxID=2985512 RepID=UPI002272239C|nr:2Fe-2S iron-sulfur cluster-binding protein [Niveibacterium sp. 24ML]MCX9156634.1 2Fe-2S iron-sulfur cluster-binding protein [Niveibacterium sp. 24ML]